jgi:hypothetical protein
MATEMTGIVGKDTPAYSSVPQTEEQRSYYTAIAVNVFGVQTFDKGHKDDSHGHLTLKIDERITPEEYLMGNNHCLWTSMPESIVALNLALALNKEIGINISDYIKASLLCGIFPLILTFLMELVTVLALWKVNSDLDGNEEFCDQSIYLQMSVVGIFLLTLLSPLQDIIKEASIGISSTRCVLDVHEGSHLFIYGSGASAGNGREFEEIGERSMIVKECKTSWPSFVVYWTSVTIEASVLLLTLWIGIHYTLSQSNASEIVQAAVAISFINEIDNMVYDAVVSEPLKDFLSKIQYEVPIMSGAGTTAFFSALYQMSFLAPVLSVFCYYTVSFLRQSHCESVE